MALYMHALFFVNLTLRLFDKHLLNVSNDFHVIVGITSINSPINFRIIFSINPNFLPSDLIMKILTLLLRKAKMFDIKINPQLLSGFVIQPSPTILNWLLILNNYSNF